MTSIALASLLVVQQTSVSQVKTLPGIRPVAMAAAPSGSRFVASLEDRNLRIMDAKTRATIRTMTGHPQTAYGVAWSPNGKWIASGDESGRVFFWNAANGQKIREVRTHTRGVQALAFNSSSSVLLSTGKDDTMRFYNVASGKELKVIYGKGANYYGAKFMPGSSSVVVGTLGQGTQIFSGYKLVKSYGGHSDKAVWDVDANGSRIVSAGRDGRAMVWGPSPSKALATLQGHGDWVVRAAISPSGGLLATSSTDSTVKIWSLRSFKLVSTLQSQSMVGAPLCFTKDGRWLITAGADDFMQINAVK